jgi:hypothetical protein
MEEEKLKVFEKKVLRRIFESKGEIKTMRSSIICTLQIILD